jgi:hypothetical protein
MDAIMELMRSSMLLHVDVSFKENLLSFLFLGFSEEVDFSFLATIRT